MSRGWERAGEQAFARLAFVAASLLATVAGMHDARGQSNATKAPASAPSGPINKGTSTPKTPPPARPPRDARTGAVPASGSGATGTSSSAGPTAPASAETTDTSPRQSAPTNGESGTESTPPGKAPAGMPVTDARTLVDLEKSPPPPTNVVYFQYGVALGAEVVSSAGAICNNQAVPCILGTGGGITIRAGWRGTGAWYLGGAYGFSKQDPNKLLRLAILQQARAEARYYFSTARDIEPYATVGVGVAGYGNEWSIDTYGPAFSFGGGLEAQITRQTVVGVAVGYRLVLLKSFMDSSGATREGGVAQFIGLDLTLEQRNPIFTERKR